MLFTPKRDRVDGVYQSQDREDRKDRWRQRLGATMLPACAAVDDDGIIAQPGEPLRDNGAGRPAAEHTDVGPEWRHHPYLRLYTGAGALIASDRATPGGSTKKSGRRS